VLHHGLPPPRPPPPPPRRDPPAEPRQPVRCRDCGAPIALLVDGQHALVVAGTWDQLSARPDRVAWIRIRLHRCMRTGDAQGVDV
jgi:hypothetical protein